jgi:hypothetical protein
VVEFRLMILKLQAGLLKLAGISSVFLCQKLSITKDRCSYSSISDLKNPTEKKNE